jgi:hypothetical protein
VLAQLSAGQYRTQRGIEGIMVALSGAATVTPDGLLGGSAVDDGCRVVGVGHAWRGELGQHRLAGGSRFRRQPAAQPRHPIDVLLAQSQAASAGPVDVGEISVRVEIGGQPLSQFDQVVGATLACQLGQVGFGLLAGTDIDAARQLLEESPDHLHMAGTDGALALSGGGRVQQRRQGFSTDCAARTQISGLGHSSAGFGAGDVQPVGQRVGQPAAQFFGRGLLSQLIDQLMARRAEPSCLLLEALQQRQPLRGGQRVILVPDNPRHHLMQRSEVRLDLLTTTRTHVRMLSRVTPDNNPDVKLQKHK